MRTSLRRAGRGAGALLAAWLVLTTMPAAAQVHADAGLCARTAEEGQRARAAGKLRDARDRFQACVVDACPVVVRQDCGAWVAEVTALLPTIVVDARDAASRDISDVMVRVDGEVITTKLDGKAIAVDPGPHRLTFERIGFDAVSEDVIIKEGIKARPFVVSFPTPREGAVATSAAGHESGRDTGTDATTNHTIWPWVVVGGGVAMATVGAVLLATAPVVRDCIRADRECVVSHNEAVEVSDDHHLWGGIFLGTGVLVAGGGLLWHFLEPTTAKTTARVRVMPWTTSTGAGFATVGTF